MIRAALLLLLAAGAAAQDSRQTAGEASARLVVLVSIDQFPTCVLRAALPFLGERGFKRLLREGTWFERCAYDHACTETGPGHATIGTGALPSLHGIVGNDWIDRGSHKQVYCVADADVQLVGEAAKGGGRSPRNLLAPTLGDTMKAHLGAAVHVLSLSWKDRAAILMAGRSADVVAWMSMRTGTMVSSTWYGAALPDWLVRFDAGKPAARFFGKEWQRVADSKAYEGLVDDRPFEGRHGGGGGRTLPVKIDGGKDAPGPAFYDQLYHTPFGNDVLIAAASAGIEAMALGRDGPPDLLCVSFSSNDAIGHRFGPRSVEVRDATLRTDLQIAELLELLDHMVGAGSYLFLLTSDHGVAPIPESLEQVHLAASRALVSPRAAAAAEQALRAAFGEPPAALQRWVLGVESGQLYLALDELRAQDVDVASAEAIAAAAVLRVPGIAFAAGESELRAAAHDPVQRMLAHALHAPRSGDVLFVLPPYCIEGPLPATHGTPYAYDREVPLLMMGPGIARGRRSMAAVTPGVGVVVAAHLLGIPSPALAFEPLPADACSR